MAIFDSGIFDTGIFDTDTGIYVTLAAKETGSDTASFSLSTRTDIVFAAKETGSDIASFAVNVSISVTFTARETGSDIFTGTGSSDGNIIVIPRDAEGGIGYLIELDAWDKTTDESATFYFADFAFTTKPTDSLPNIHFLERVQSPGNYDRSLFGAGTTYGQITVGAGFIELAANDGALDRMRPEWFAFDGYDLTIKTVERLRPRYDDAVTVFRGTVEQVELTWQRATIRLRDRLATLDVEHQEDVFAGTTVSGGMNEAEGMPDDLKDRPKPLAYGAPQLVPGVEANRFKEIFAFANDGMSAIEDVRDRGAILTPTGVNYATVAELAAATVAAGRYSTCLAKGLIKTGSVPDGQITGRPIGIGTNTAAQVARRILERQGFVAGVNFLLDDITALDALNAAPIGYWTGTEEQTSLIVLQKVLGSIGATIAPDRLGIFRLVRFDAPTGYPKAFITAAEALEIQGGRGIQLIATGDQGRGVPAWRVTNRWGYNYHVMRREDIADEAIPDDPAFVAFASQEWRNAVAEDPNIKAAHKLASDLVYETYLINETDAQDEADRLLALHSVPRDRFQIPVKPFLVDHVELGDTVNLKFNRFGLDAGKDFTVIGIEENFGTRDRSAVTTLDLWG